MKKILISILALVALLGPVARAGAEDAAAKMKPVVVLSLAGYDELFHDLEFVGQISDNPDLGKGLEGLIAMFTQWQGLAGLDKTRPLGAAVTTDGAQFQMLGFVPVKDLKKLYSALAGIIGEPEDAGDGVSRFNTNAIPVYVKQHGEWAFIGQSPESFTDLPDDPSKLLGSLTSEYDLALRVHLQNIPEVFRQMAIDQLKAGVQAGLDHQKDDDEDDKPDLTKKMVQTQLDQLLTVINDIDQFTIGWAIDASGRRALFDFSLTAMAESKLAKQIAVTAGGASRFAGFLLPDALLTAHMNSAVAPEDTEKLAALTESLKTQLGSEIDKSDEFDDDQEKQVVKGLLNEFLDLVANAAKKGIINGGATVVGSGPFTLAAGGYFGEGDKLEALFKRAADAFEDDDDEDSPKFKFDVDKHKGVGFHTVKMPIDDEDMDDDTAEMVENILGEELLFTLGFGSDSVYIALGEQGIKTIKQVIDESADPKKAGDREMQVSLALAPVLKFASEQKKADPMLGMAADGLKQSGKDHLLLTAQRIANGVRYRLEAEEGVLKLIGTAIKAAAVRGPGR